MKQAARFGLATLAAVAAVMTPAIVLAAGGSGGVLSGGSGFDAVVRAIESRYRVHASKLPFTGLISLLAGHATHGGVRGLHVAEIEHLNQHVDGAELNALVSDRMGAGWQRIVRDTSRGGDEQSLIFVKPQGDRLGMLVVDLDRQEMNLVEVSIEPDKLSDEIAGRRQGRDASGNQPEAVEDTGDSE